MKWSSQAGAWEADATDPDVEIEYLNTFPDSLSVTLADDIQHHNHLDVLQANKNSQAITVQTVDLTLAYLRRQTGT